MKKCSQCKGSPHCFIPAPILKSSGCASRIHRAFSERRVLRIAKLKGSAASAVLYGPGVSWGEVDPCVSISKGFSASLLTRQKRRKYKDLPLSRFATAPLSRGAFLSITVGDNQNGCTSGRSLTDVRDDILRGIGNH